jgi:hypothetical protein
MFRLVCAFVVAALFTAFAVNRSASGEDSNKVTPSIDRTVIAAAPAAHAQPPDDYAGVYRTADGATFVVVRDGDSLTIELPETVALPIRATGPSFVLDSSIVQIAFEADGSNVRMVLTRGHEQAVVATRVTTRRGVVTIHDI